jgi:Ni/Fe-hydrogenase subunit HybB-like protein
MGHHEFQKQEGKLFGTSFFVLLTLTVIGMSLIAFRYIKGLGAVSNMSDGYPWGIWITYDVATGTAIACGGYAVAILIYIRNRLHYHPLIRSCILTSMLGYGLAGFSVMVDLGRPWNSYNFFVPWRWQFNSVMFEVALCVMAYSTVLIIEFLPAILSSLETTKWRRLRAGLDWLRPRLDVDPDQVLTRIEWIRAVAGWIRPRLEKVLIFFIVLGVTLPTMHQSSLGSLLLIAPTKLSPVWHTGFLPLFFLINCIYIGYAIAILESIIASYAFKRPYEVKELSGLATVIPWLTLVWLAIVGGDLVLRGQVHAALSLDFHSGFFLLDCALLIVGSFVLISRQNRHSPRWLFVSATLIVLGGALYRFNVYLIGFDPGQGWTYFPSLAEIMISVGIVSLELLCYQLLVKLCPVLPTIRTRSGGHRQHSHGGLIGAVGAARAIPVPAINVRAKDRNSRLEPV